jgi:hypothetical protein
MGTKDTLPRAFFERPLAPKVFASQKRFSATPAFFPGCMNSCRTLKYTRKAGYRAMPYTYKKRSKYKLDL